MNIAKCLPAVLALLTGAAVWGNSPTLRGKNFQLTASDHRQLFLTTPDGERQLLEFGGLPFGWSDHAAEIASIKQLDDRTLQVDYRITNDPGRQMTGSAVYTVDGDRLKVAYQLDVPRDTEVGGVMYVRIPRDGKLGGLVKSGFWTRHPGGGVPYEAVGPVLRRIDGGELTVWEEINGNALWSGDWNQHLSFRRQDDGGHYTASNSFLVTPKATDGEQAAARLAGRPLAISFAGGQPNHLFRPGEAMTVDYRIANVSDDEIAGRPLVITVHDLDGGIVHSETGAVTLAPGETRQKTLTLPAADEPAIYFVEVASPGEPEIFTRTTLASLDETPLRHPDSSIFGMAATFPIPDREAVYRLLSKLGVRYLRSGDNNECAPYGLVAFFHSHYSPEEWRQLSPADQRQHFADLIDQCDRQRNPVWEFGNENSFKTVEEAAEYVAYLKLIRELIREKQSPLELCSIGFSNGFDGIGSLQNVHAAGGWPLLDSIAYHLGRGNMTPDDESMSSTWNYLPSLKELRSLLRQYGDKPVYLTEVYAYTRPNFWWCDTMRRAAENVVLSYALAKAEQVKVVFFYQLMDSIWADIGGVSETDGEYFYGLFDRFGAPKASALSYAATARRLDGAEFVRYVEPADEVRGIEFKTADGAPLLLLWDRAEGGIQSEDSPGYAGLEPWEKHWRQSRKLSLPATGAVTVYDFIGRQRQLTPAGGRIELELSGEPVWVAGATL